MRLQSVSRSKNFVICHLISYFPFYFDTNLLFLPQALLSQHYEKHPIVILKDVKFQELKSMMDYMYKGEVNISQDQLGQFLKAAESLQIKGLTDGGGENDSRDVGSTSQKRHEPTPARKAAVPHQSRSPLVLPSHSTGELNLLLI